MTERRLPVAELKRDFRRVLDAAEQGHGTVVLRNGRPVARVAPFEGEGRPRLPRPARPGGLLAVSGLLADWETFEADIAEIVRGRADVADRPAPDFAR